MVCPVNGEPRASWVHHATATDTDQRHSLVGHCRRPGSKSYNPNLLQRPAVAARVTPCRAIRYAKGSVRSLLHHHQRHSPANAGIQIVHLQDLSSSVATGRGEHNGERTPGLTAVVGRSRTKLINPALEPLSESGWSRKLPRPSLSLNSHVADFPQMGKTSP